MGCIKNYSKEEKELIIKCANYIVNTRTTVLATAKIFNIPYSSLYYKIYNILPKLNPKLYEKVRQIMSINLMDAQKKAHQANVIKGVKRIKDLEDYILANLDENQTKLLTSEEIKKIFDNIHRKNINKYLNRMMEDSSYIIKIIERDSQGNMLFGIKDKDEICTMPDVQGNIFSLSRQRDTEGQIVNLIYNYILSKIQSNADEEYVHISIMEVATAVGKSVSYTTKIIRWLVNDKTSKIEKMYKVTRSGTKSYFKLSK